MSGQSSSSLTIGYPYAHQTDSAFSLAAQAAADGQTRLTGGLLHARQIVNRSASLKHGHRMLGQAGIFNNLRLAIGESEG